MASGGQPQFRYTQPPSKVLHLRNLPWDCTPEELVELGTPFGKVVNTKCGVGANRNQAFIEFADQNQAIAMISYYASSAEPAQVRGKNVYLQYSNRQEIINNKTTGEGSGNVLLVGMEGVAPDSVSIDVLHVVFSAFGFVHKIATFEKASGYQALIQFSDAETATSAKAALDGRCIPSYLLPELDGACTLRITYSAHSVLNVKYQSHRSRDFTNPYLPFLDSAKDGSGVDGKKQEAESNILLASVENMQYVVTIDVLHEVFSAFGFVQKIAIFEKNGFQALIQYPDIQTAVAAKEALEGHSIYEGGYCKLHLTFSRHTELNVKVNNERGRDYTKGSVTPSSDQPSILGPQPIPNVGAAIPPAQGSVPSAATNSVMPSGDPSVAVPSNPSSEPLLQAPVVSSGGPAQYPSQAILQAPPGVAPGFPGYGALQFAQVSAQAQMVQPSGQGSQQMSSHVNYQLPPGSAQFMQYLGNGSHPLPNAPGPQTMPYPALGGQQLPPGPQMMQAPGFGGLPFSQGPGQPMPQFPMYGTQQFPPGMEPQMMRFPEQGGQQFTFAPRGPYGR
uniref:Polypyrimidine n=1 Tax=Saccharum hybrid cultivar SP80-3280 TaxID=193079 RepID=A0A2R4QNE5_9POAL|nr:polypyrimidine tract-binding [Saccharum hybrid cultivar SP80-3280]AVY91711.1 polypyrimidine [Saccharum hybrid cultivar SP80-3280]AVY91718.1 polypyrimidine [Saccharum hybrid cultivar SP80-3280]